MPIPSLSELPPAPSGRSGWPWTDAPDPLPGTLPNDAAWPRVSIVTVSFNQGQYLEETIRSVLLQGYPNLEYIVIDGGSTDDSVAIIERYAPWISDWVSEPDRGQADALNKGFARTSGDWLGWLNSDDVYTPGALGELMTCANATQVTLISGATIHFYEDGTRKPYRMLPQPDAFAPDTLARAQCFDQPGCLWSRDVWDHAGPLDLTLTYAFDWRFFQRCAEVARPATCDSAAALYRHHAGHKSGSGGGSRQQELIRVLEQSLSPEDRAALRRVIPWLALNRRILALREQIGLWRLWGVVRDILRRVVVERPPALHPYVALMLGLPHTKRPFPRLRATGLTAARSAADALAAFPPGITPGQPD